LKKKLLFFLTLVSVFVSAQNTLDQKLDGREQGKKLTTFIQELESKNPVHFFYLDQWIESITIEQSYEGQTVREALTDLFLGTDIDFLLMNENSIVLVKDPSVTIQRNNLINSAIRERKKIQKLSIGNLREAKRGQKVILHGHVRNAESKDPLVGSSIIATDEQVGTTTDATGGFELRVSAGAHVISIMYLNFEEKIIDLEIYKDGNAELELEETPTLLDEVVVSDVASNEITTRGIGQAQLSIRELKRAPSLLGEVDLIKQIQILPGVTTAGEAASGFNVRGGSVDQNLVLYDGMPVFNSSHVFGFFSAFNAEAIRDVTFYKGGIPAEYGGRISSVLDIRSKEGDYEKWKASGGVGLISSNLLLNGPIKKDKTSIAISMRSTYSNWLVHSVRTNYADLSKSSVFFYDGALKLAHKFNDNTKLTATVYASHDQFKLTGDSTYRWSNLVSSIRLDHQFSPALNANFSIGAGAYGYELFDENVVNGFNLSYKISFPTAKAEFHFQNGLHKISFGAQSTLYAFDPGTLKPSSEESSTKNIKMDRQRSSESAFFVGDNILLNEKLSLEAGVRLSMFSSFGPAIINIYKAGEARETSTGVDTQEYSRGKAIKTYFGVEPRLSFRYSFARSFSAKVGYNRMYQYLHLVSNTTAITPIDIWQPSGYYFKPQKADQLSLGLYKNFKERVFETFVEVFYKKINNVLDFKDGAQLILNSHIETDLLQGQGRAYGIETSVAKTIGLFTGSINYTYSRSLRTISGLHPNESINEGKEYSSNFDQPHTVNLSWRYGITRRYFFTGNFTYRTGRPVTTPETGFTIDHVTVAGFSERNQYRIPDYHRLDLAFVIEGNHKRKKFLDGTWSLSVYNVYARKNAYSVFFRDNGNGVLRPYKLSIIGTALPSISYSFKL
jgi:hypothetical protein